MRIRRISARLWSGRGRLLPLGALCTVLFAAAPAAAQVTPTSELWREWVVVNRMIDDAREEAERARRAAQARRAQRAARAPVEAPGR